MSGDPQLYVRVQILGGYLFPNDEVMSWWNARVPPDQQYPRTTPASAVLIDLVMEKFAIPELGERMVYEPGAHRLGSGNKETKWVWVPMVEDELIVPVERVKACRVSEDLTHEHTTQFKKYFEEELRFSFAEHGVWWHNRRHTIS